MLTVQYEFGAVFDEPGVAGAGWYEPLSGEMVGGIWMPHRCVMNGRSRDVVARRVIVGVLLAAAVLTGCAPVPPSHLLGVDRPRSCVPRIGTNQIIVPLPGLLLPLPSIKGLSEFDDLDAAPSGLDLPVSVQLRDNRQGFNSYAEFALADGSLYTRPRNSGTTWRSVPTPSCLDGEIVSVSVDSNMAVVLDSDGWIYSLDNLLSGPLLWNWTRSFGGPIWLWPGMQVPTEAQAAGKWALSHRMSDSFIDAKGYEHPLTAGLVQLVGLTDGGSRIVFQDPWLPGDHSYEIGGPLGGRFISESISTSGSVTFVMNRFGDMYTRKYDLDLAGANHIPGRYTWQDQGDKPSAPNQFEERVNESYAAIALPAEEWQHQPKIPGEITSRISISQSGSAVEDRVLRVEGRDDGKTGYWQKELAADHWEFITTGDPLVMSVLADADPTVDQSAVELAAPNGLDFEGSLGGGWSASLGDFDWAQTVHRVILRSPAGNEYEIKMYTTDGMRLEPRASGLDRHPRMLEGALDLTAALSTTDGDELGDFVATRLQRKPIFEIWVQATTEKLVVSPAQFFIEPMGTLRRR